MAQVAFSRTAGPFTIVLTGPECTGKSTLAGELAARLDAVVSREFARAYVEGRREPLGAADVEPIARGQIAIEDEAQRQASHALVKDTDLVSTVVYAHHYYGKCPAWIERRARARLGHLYLLLEPDVPWLADGWQRESPQRRVAAHDLFGRTLRAWKAQVTEISGTWDERRARALAAVAKVGGGGGGAR
jgi:NadR type nicotinamide-nucleotide adenylyltransferase